MSLSGGVGGGGGGGGGGGELRDGSCICPGVSSNTVRCFNAN